MLLPATHFEFAVEPLGPLLPVAERVAVRLRFRQVNEFLGLYLARLRRGETMVVPAPRYTFAGDLIDLDVRVDFYRPLLLFAEVTALQLKHIEVMVVCGPSTDRLVRPLLVRALGPRHAEGLLRAPIR